MSNPSSISDHVSIHDMEWKGITLTDKAAARISSLTQEGQYFHLSVRSSGCTGFAYDVKLVEEVAEDDLEYTSHNASIYVALSAMPMLDGTEIDFVRQGLNSNFVYNNPNVKNLCGCGESFGV